MQFDMQKLHFIKNEQLLALLMADFKDYSSISSLFNTPRIKIKFITL